MVEEVNVDLASVLSDSECEDGASDSGTDDVIDVLRVVCLVRELSLVVEELLEEDTAGAVEVVVIRGSDSVKDGVDKELLSIIAVTGVGSCGG